MFDDRFVFNFKIICFLMRSEEDLLCKLLVSKHHEAFLSKHRVSNLFKKGLVVSKDGSG